MQISPPPARIALSVKAADGLPPLTDKAYAVPPDQGRDPIKGRDLAVENRSHATLLTAVRAIGERAHAELKERWRCLRRSVRLCLSRIGQIVVAAAVPPVNATTGELPLPFFRALQPPHEVRVLAGNVGDTPGGLLALERLLVLRIRILDFACEPVAVEGGIRDQSR